MRKNEENFAILLSNKIFLKTLKRIALSATNARAMLPRTSDNQWAATITLDKDMLAAQALAIMNKKKITCLCVHQKNKKNKTIGFIHIHNILNAIIT